MPEPAIEPLDAPPTLRQRVFERLEDLIADGVLAPGAHLVETDLATRLGVSRGPVREALQQLQRDGWVDLRPRQGAFVREPTLQEVDDFFDVRALLEAECARLAACSIDARGAEVLREQLAAGRRLVPEGTAKELLAANAVLHASITQIAGNGVLDELVSTMRKRARWYFAPVSKQRAPRAWAEHELVVTAVVEGDADAAAAAMREHVNSTRRDYLAFRDSGRPRNGGDKKL